MCPVYFVNDVTGLHRIYFLPFKGRSEVGMGENPSTKEIDK